MSQPLRLILIWAFVIFNVTDIITTLMAGLKHGFEYEINLIYVFTGSITITFIIKIILVCFIIYVLTTNYRRLEYPVMRYLVVYIFVTMTFTLAFVSYSNYGYYKIPKTDISPPMENHEKIQYNKDIVHSGEMLNPQSVTNKTDRGSGGIVLFNLFQFMVWRSFEKWRTMKLHLRKFGKLHLL